MTSEEFKKQAEQAMQLWLEDYFRDVEFIPDPDAGEEPEGEIKGNTFDGEEWAIPLAVSQYDKGEYVCIDLENAGELELTGSGLFLYLWADASSSLANLRKIAEAA